MHAMMAHCHNTVHGGQTLPNRQQLEGVAMTRLSPIAFVSGHWCQLTSKRIY